MTQKKQFKVGDRVRRIIKPCGNLQVGDEGIIREAALEDAKLEGDTWTYDSAYLELVIQDQIVNSYPIF